ncbi:MAG: nucleoside triphosphate pyrophosphohydrolase family protein [Rivularia sp. T60_A2020_040]|nr:nucleoside triphosphate pyrophosphohydrolase family protein [Rivularia sp. T60_A2020_040]
MDFREYQEKALISDQVPKGTENAIIVPLLGLVGEAGSLLTEYKKYLRDGDSHKLFKARIAEELGDLLWYVANVASKFDLDLKEIAQKNLDKCCDRWGWKDLQTEGKATGYNFDREFPKHERLPRQLEVEITEVKKDNSVKMKAFIDGEQIGDDLTNNSYISDGYRFHDIFHLSYAAILGWSPVLRSNLKCNEVKRKRKSNPRVDEVEDGGRAIAIEEGISALIFAYAKDHKFLEGVSAIDYELLKTIKNMTLHLEVSECSLNDWQKAILMGYEVWRQVDQNRGGMVFLDLDGCSITYQIGGRYQK